MIKNKSIITILVVLLWVSLAQAQGSANSSGGNATGIGGSVAYSVGQVIYTTNTSISGSVAQGVQHAYEIFNVGIKKTELNISLTAFPNPTEDNLTLQISENNNEKLNYQLFDMQGKLLSNGEIIAQQTRINTANLPSSTYFISVVNEKNIKIQTFKIIKN
jgi:hypothetical protein